MRRFAIKRTPPWRFLLGLFGVTTARASLEIDALRLAAPQPTRLLGLPLHVQEVCVSVEDPAAVREALEA